MNDHGYQVGPVVFTGNWNVVAYSGSIVKIHIGPFYYHDQAEDCVIELTKKDENYTKISIEKA